MTLKIAFLSKVDVNIRQVQAVFAPQPVANVRTRQELIEAIPDIDILIVQNQGFKRKSIDAECLRNAGRLRLIQHHGVAADTTDVTAASARGIPVATAPGQNSQSVAEHAFFLLMALVRRLRESERLVQNGQMGEVECVELQGKILCLVGLGAIGKSLAKMANGFGMEVIGVRRSQPKDEPLPPGVARVLPATQLNDALAQADFTILALPLNDQTLGLMNEVRFAVMKPGSFLVNVSRGGHVERPALEAALNEGKIAGYAADVFWSEPADPADPLLADERVIITPHMGGKSVEAMRRSARAVYDNILRLERGEPLFGVVDAPSSAG